MITRITDDVMAEQSVEFLPDREVMALVNSNIAIPINAALALNVLSDGSIAYADAAQLADIDQSI